jgi:hypothetical protein
MGREERFGINRGRTKIEGVVSCRRRRGDRRKKDSEAERSEACEPDLARPHSEHEVVSRPRRRKSTKRQPTANYFGADHDFDGVGMDLDAFQGPKAPGAKKAAPIEDNKWRSARDAIVNSHYNSVVEQRSEALEAVHSRVECWQRAADEQTCRECSTSFEEQVVRVIFLSATADVRFKLRRCDMYVLNCWHCCSDWDPPELVNKALLARARSLVQPGLAECTSQRHDLWL